MLWLVTACRITKEIRIRVTAASVSPLGRGVGGGEGAGETSAQVLERLNAET